MQIQTSTNGHEVWLCGYLSLRPPPCSFQVYSLSAHNKRDPPQTRAAAVPELEGVPIRLDNLAYVSVKHRSVAKDERFSAKHCDLYLFST